MWPFGGPRAISKLRLTPPRPAPGRLTLAIAFVVRNEARHIGEWARFHRLAGVEHFICYDNGCTDDTVAELKVHAGHQHVTVIPWDQKLFDGRGGAELHNQTLAFAHALRNFGPHFRWLAFIDPDEFIVPVLALTISEVLHDLDNHACISLPWIMFGRAGHDAPPEGGIVANYLRRAADPLAHPRALKFKCIVDATRVTAAQVHQFEIDGAARGANDVGTVAPHAQRGTAGFVSTARLQLHHYYTRSDQELRAKITRGSNKTVAAERHAKRVLRMVEMIEENELEDRTALEFLARHGRQEI
ncbi:MAG: glycosyltransferase family 92 protein [Shimia sp.]